MVAKLDHLWLVQPFQHGRMDASEAPNAFATEAEAVAYAKAWVGEVSYAESTEHECVVFKAVASYRGRVTAVKHQVAKDED